MFAYAYLNSINYYDYHGLSTEIKGYWFLRPTLTADNVKFKGVKWDTGDVDMEPDKSTVRLGYVFLSVKGKVKFLIYCKEVECEGKKLIRDGYVGNEFEKEVFVSVPVKFKKKVSKILSRLLIWLKMAEFADKAHNIARKIGVKP